MAIIHVCSGCTKRLTLSNDREGTTFPCPLCHTTINLPFQLSPEIETATTEPDGGPNGAGIGNPQPKTNPSIGGTPEFREWLMANMGNPLPETNPSVPTAEVANPCSTNELILKVQPALDSGKAQPGMLPITSLPNARETPPQTCTSTAEPNRVRSSLIIAAGMAGELRIKGSRYWQIRQGTRLRKEVVEIGMATIAQTVRLARYGVAIWHHRTWSPAARTAELVHGRRL